MTNEMGAMYSSRFCEVSVSAGFVSRMPCSTLLIPRMTVAVRAATRPTKRKEGSAPATGDAPRAQAAAARGGEGVSAGTHARARTRAPARAHSPVASTTPSITGASARYVLRFSVVPAKAYAISAVHAGVVAPIAWLNDTGMYLRLVFPAMTLRVKTAASVATRRRWSAEDMRCSGTTCTPTIVA